MKRFVAHIYVVALLQSGLQGSPEEPVVHISNYQPFAVSLPVQLPGSTKSFSTTNQGAAVQEVNHGQLFVADIAASSTMTIRAGSGSKDNRHSEKQLRGIPKDNGIAFEYDNTPLGLLSWDLLSMPAPVKTRSSRDLDGITGGDGDNSSTALGTAQLDFAAHFNALPLTFKRKVEGPVRDAWSASTTTGGLSLTLDIEIYHAGFLDIRGTLANLGVEKPTGVYCVVLTKWQHPKLKQRTLAYDSTPMEFGETTTTSFRAGEGHHLALQRGIDWIRSDFGHATVAWLNDFSESYTAFNAGSKKTGARWLNANQPQLGQEAQATPGALYIITEITRPVIKRFADRYTPYVLPAKGESTGFESRLFISGEPMTDKQVDERFVGYTCYRTQTEGSQPHLTIGVPHVKFATSYFPYSTLGENFGRYKLQGQDREGYWPLSADTVNHWQLFADDIRRDLRIAKAMGFEVLRLHHIELLADIKPNIREQYLDFFFGEMRHLQLKALLDIQMKPDEVASMVKRYRDVIDGVEVENEVLIWGIKDGRQNYWNSVYDAVKSVAPDMPVHLTAHSNTGIFNQLEKLGGKSDRIGFHSYVDTPAAIGTARGMALAVGNYAAKVGKPPVITEWNWRFFTRIPFEERAKFYKDIVGNALVTRSIPEFHQFQFIESLAMNPKGLGGIRHYEPIFLSRRPKPEAFELMKLMRNYGDPELPSNQLDAQYVSVELDRKGRASTALKLVNRSGKALTLTPSVETATSLSVQFKSDQLKMEPGQELSLPVDISTTETVPGFYPFFVRLEGADAFVRYAWCEARLAGSPRLDFDTPTTVTYGRGIKDDLNLDFAKPISVVYGGMDSPGSEVEYAILVANTLESAIGHPVSLYNQETLPEDHKGDTRIVIGTSASNSLVNEGLSGKAFDGEAVIVRVHPDKTGSDWLVITGKDTAQVEAAATDFVLRYWRNAKDSAIRRVGSLVEKTLPKGSDPTKLP